MSTLSVVYPSGRSSRVAFYLRKSGDDDVFPLGGVYKRSGDSFPETEYATIADDPGLCATKCAVRAACVVKPCRCLPVTVPEILINDRYEKDVIRCDSMLRRRGIVEVRMPKRN